MNTSRRDHFPAKTKLQPNRNVANTIALAPNVHVPESVLRFTFSRSSGPGGQNVNKLNTRATLVIHLEDLAPHLSAPVINRLVSLAGSRFTESPDRIILSSDTSRSQISNKRDCQSRLRELIVQAVAIPKRRRKTKPSRRAVERRLEKKRQRSEVKSLRNYQSNEG